jgi:hypothetical protein
MSPAVMEIVLNRGDAEIAEETRRNTRREFESAEGAEARCAVAPGIDTETQRRSGPRVGMIRAVMEIVINRGDAEIAEKARRNARQEFESAEEAEARCAVAPGFGRWA